jgi:ABC-type lipoprotein release transport system permease subunit
VLAGFLGLLAVLAVGHALVTGVHRRRRDFAVLRTLGFVGRQVAATVAWQASTLAVVGLVLGVPLGLVAGRWTWAVVAEGVGVATDPAVPVVALLIAAPATLLVANAVAVVPGRIAARTRPAVVLRAE